MKATRQDTKWREGPVAALAMAGHRRPKLLAELHTFGVDARPCKRGGIVVRRGELAVRIVDEPNAAPATLHRVAELLDTATHENERPDVPASSRPQESTNDTRIV